MEAVGEPRKKKLKFPPNISKVPSAKLGFLLSKYASLSSYYDTIVAKAEIDWEIARHNVNFLRSKLLLQARGPTIAERKAHRTVQYELGRIKKEGLKAKARYLLLLTYRRTCDKFYQCVSREVSRREQEFARSRD